MADKDLQMQRKKSDGTFDKYYPKTKTHLVVDDTTGQTIKEQYADIVNGTTKVGNADKLDNKDSSEFANATHSHTKANITDFPTSLPANGGNADTVGNVQLGNLAESKSTGNTDLNTIIKSGMYRVEGAANTPLGLAYGQLLVIHGGNDTITQIYGHYLSGVLYTRSGNPPNVGGTGSWSIWKQILTTSELPINHASGAITYGLGTRTAYGHVALIEDLVGGYGAGHALHANQGKVLDDKIKIDSINLITTITLSHTSTIDITNYIKNPNYDELYFVLEGTINLSSTRSAGANTYIGLSRNNNRDNEVDTKWFEAFVKSTLNYSAMVKCKARYIKNAASNHIDGGGDISLWYGHETMETGNISISGNNHQYLMITSGSGYNTSSGNVTLKIYGITRAS